MSAGSDTSKAANRHFGNGKPIHVQTPACDRCSVGVMDAKNPHLYGECDCDCHAENPAYGPGNPDWEYDRDRLDSYNAGAEEFGGAFDGVVVTSDAEPGL